MKTLLSLFLLMTSLQAFSSVYEELDGTSSHINGPNCWNGALYAAGVVEHKRMFHPDEWLYVLNQHCEQVDRPLRGDVGRIVTTQGEEVHGFIYLGDDQGQSMIFAKHGERTEHGYQIMSFEEMLRSYGRVRECRIRRDESPECINDIVYYRCQGDLELPEQLARVNQLLEELTFSEETRWRFRATCQEEAHLRREEILREMTSLLSDFDYQAAGVDGELYRVMLTSYRSQIHRTRTSNRNFRCRPRELRDQHDQAFQEFQQFVRAQLEQFE